MLHTVPLNSSHNKKDFRCEEQSLESYLKTQASQDMRKKQSACFILEGSNGFVNGYYTLSSDGIAKNLLSEELRKKYPYSTLPVTLLGRLARDFTLKGQNIGAILLADALIRAFENSDKVASCAVVTDPINERAERFYASFGFLKLESGRMFVTMDTIANTLIKARK